MVTRVFDAAAVEVGTLDLILVTPIRPVHLAVGHVQRDAFVGYVQSLRSTRVFDTAAVEVGTLDIVRYPLSVQYILPPATSNAMAYWRGQVPW